MLTKAVSLVREWLESDAFDNFSGPANMDVSIESLGDGAKAINCEPLDDIDEAGFDDGGLETIQSDDE